MIHNFDKLTKTLKSKFYNDYNISKLTWFRTGGTADIYCIAYNKDELEIILNNININTPLFIIGMGSNLLVRDQGFRGIIIKLGKSFNHININEDFIDVGASVLDVNLSQYAYEHSLSGLEFFSGIPGSIGGAVKMNAGCFGAETKDHLEKISIINNQGLKKTLDKESLNFSYRKSNLSDDDIVISAIFKGQKNEKKTIESNINRIKFYRENSQPVKTKTGGSTFKNPDNLFAAKLIEQSDCKGLSFGDAIISQKHSNFIINLGNASASDIESLGKIVQEKVNKKFGILLEWEIKIIGEKN